jgi:hypothetical protein
MELPGLPMSSDRAFDLVALLCDPRLRIPRLSDGFDDLMLGSDLGEFNDLASRVDDPRLVASNWAAALRTASDLSSALSESVQLYLDAKPSKALACLGASLVRARSHLVALRTNPIGGFNIGDCYRVRTDCDSGPGVSGIFHVPFELRHLVSRQRYSFPGIPCLYVSQSVYCCWHEMGQPPLGSMWISRLRLRASSKLKLFDMGWRPHWVAGMLNVTRSPDAVEFATSYIAMWPLIAACAYRNPGRDGSEFVAEYIIPQLLTEWLVSDSGDEFGGIRYASSRIHDEDIGLAGMSIAMPAKTFPHRGPCKVLGALWESTIPVRWDTILSCHDGQSSSRFGEEKIDVAGHKIDYHETQFSKAERFLERLPLHAIDMPDTGDGVFSRW